CSALSPFARAGCERRSTRRRKRFPGPSHSAATRTAAVGISAYAGNTATRRSVTPSAARRRAPDTSHRGRPPPGTQFMPGTAEARWAGGSAGVGGIDPPEIERSRGAVRERLQRHAGPGRDIQEPRHEVRRPDDQEGGVVHADVVEDVLPQPGVVPEWVHLLD